MVAVEGRVMALGLGFVATAAVAITGLGALHLAPLDAGHGALLQTARAEDASASASLEWSNVTASASGSGIIVQEFTVPDQDSTLNLDITISSEDLDEGDVAFLRRTNDSDVGHHLFSVRLREGEISGYTVASGTGDVSGVYATAASTEAGTGLDGGSYGAFTDYESASSHGEDIRLAVLFTRSIVEIDTEVRWKGEVGEVHQESYGNESVLTLDLDDFENGVGANVRPGPSAGVSASSGLHADEMLGYFAPSQGPGYVRYTFDGPDRQPREGEIIGLQSPTLKFHGSTPGDWTFELDGSSARDDARPVVLAGDLQGDLREGP